MPRLILLNGAPGTGKSTLAQAWQCAAPGRGLVEIDLIKHSLTTWPSDPHAAGLQARELATVAIGATLEAGDDVIVPQFLGRADFADQLAGVAAAVGAEFVQVVLTLEPAAHRERLSARARRPDRPEQVENDRGLERDRIHEMAAAIADWTSEPRQVLTVDAAGALDVVLTRLEGVLKA